MVTTDPREPGTDRGRTLAGASLVRFLAAGLAAFALAGLVVGCAESTPSGTGGGDGADTVTGDAAAVPEAAAPRGEASIGEPPKSTGPPEIEFEETSHDFGRVYIGDPAEHVFRFHNVGGGDLVLKRLKPNCTSCTVAEFTRDPIPPGGEGTVRIRLTSAEEQKSRKYVDVFSNAANERSGFTRLTVQGDFKRRIWYPDLIQLGKIRQGMRFPSKQIEIEWLADRPLEIEGVTSSHPDLVEIETTPYESGDRRGIRLDLRFGDPRLLLSRSRANHVYGSITVETDDPVFREIVTRFTGEVQEDVVVVPRTLVCKRSDDSGIEAARLKLAGAPNAQLVLDGYECTLPFLEVTVDEKQPGVLFEITVTADAEVPPGPHEGKLLLHTNFEKQPEFIVPILISG
jgi:hypothetical protein